MTLELNRFEACVRSGDLVLTGSRRPVARLAQFGTDSKYSHVAVVVDDALIESRDPALTPAETDEGCRSTPFDEFLERDDRMTHLLVLRPSGVRVDDLRHVADRLTSDPPPYPTVGIVMLGLCLLNEKFLVSRRFDRNRLLRFCAENSADGRSMMHCAELAACLLEWAGTSVDFDRLVLQRHVDLLHELGLLSLVRATSTESAHKSPSAPETPGRATLGAWISAYRARRQAVREAHFYDFVLPADFERSPSLQVAGAFERSGANWHDTANQGM